MSFGKGGGGGKGKGDSGNINIRRTRNQLNALSEAALSQFARFGQIGQQTPFGTFEFEGEIGSPERRLVQRFSPQVQAAVDRQLAAQATAAGVGQEQAGRLSNILAQPVLGGQDLAASAAQLEQATFDRNLSLLQPQFDRQRTQLVTRLANQGIPQGSQAFNEAVNRLERSQGEQLERLAQSSVSAGRAEQSRLLQTDLARRSQAINELQGLLTAGRPQQSGFQALPTQGVQQQNLAQLQQQQLGQQQFAKSGKRQTLGDVASVGSIGLLGAGLISDRRVKRDVRPLGTVTLYEFNYQGDAPGTPPRRGFMAQDIEPIAPDAVFTVAGVKAIDYGKLVGLR